MMLPAKHMKLDRWGIYCQRLKTRVFKITRASSIPIDTAGESKAFPWETPWREVPFENAKTACSNAGTILVGFVIILLSLTGCSASIQDSANMLVNLSSVYPQLQRLITSTAFLIGLGLTMRAIYYLKVYGEMRTMMASQGNLKAPIIYLIVAVALIYLPQTINDLMLSSFGTTEISPLSYNTTSVEGLSLQASNAILGFVEIIGLISFVRGWIIIAKNAQGSAQGASFGKGATHIIGGILAINIVGTKDAIWGTLGLS